MVPVSPPLWWTSLLPLDRLLALVDRSCFYFSLSLHALPEDCLAQVHRQIYTPTNIIIMIIVISINIRMLIRIFSDAGTHLDAPFIFNLD